jgi:uncharacterized protein YndB with AHSA1/START domain
MSNAQTSTVPALVVKRTFNAPRERVFQMMTKVELLRQWFGPPGSTLGDVTFDARNGGRYRIPMKMPDGEDFIVGGTITEFRAPERLAYSFTWEEDDKSTEYDTFVTVDLIERGNQTEMIFTHEQLASEESRDRHAHGWDELFNRMEALL